MRRFLLLLLIVAALVSVSVASGGCGTQAPAERIERQAMPFLEDGRLTREQAVLQLGVPSADFDAGRVLCYRLAIEESGSAFWARPLELTGACDFLGYPFDPPSTNPWGYSSFTWSEFSLVLVFDGGGVLQRHRLARSGPTIVH